MVSNTKSNTLSYTVLQLHTIHAKINIHVYCHNQLKSVPLKIHTDQRRQKSTQINLVEKSIQICTTKIPSISAQGDVIPNQYFFKPHHHDAMLVWDAMHCCHIFQIRLASPCPHKAPLQCLYFPLVLPAQASS